MISSYLSKMIRKYKILISNAGFGSCNPQALSLLKERFDVIGNVDGTRFDDERFLGLSDGVNAIIAGTEKITSRVINAYQGLQLIARVGAGVDSVDLAAAAAQRISITYTPDVPALAVPEFTLALMLGLVRKVSVSDGAMHRGQWLKPTGDSLGDLHVGIAGAGKIGRRVIEILRSIYPHIEISYYDPSVPHIEGARKCDLDTLIKEADILSLHVPLIEATKNILNERTIGSMKRGSYIINTARGGVVCEKALYDALKQGHLAGAALDVYEQEPYKGDLKDLENCILTSHIGSLTKQVRAVMEQQIAEDVVSFFESGKLSCPLPGYDFYNKG